MNKQEITLVSEAQSGNSKCFEELYELYYRKVFAVIKATVKNNADAEDILQQTFLSAWRKLNTLSDPAAFNTWIQRIALNECYSLLRRKNMAILLDSEQELENMDTEVSEELIPAVYAEREDLRIRLGKILEGLSEVQRQTVTLYYFNELKVEEIAEIMDCSTGTVKTRLFLGRKAIRSEIEEQERKSGQKFYGVAGIPMLGLSQILAQQAEAASLPTAVSESILQNIRTSIAGEAAAAAQAASSAAPQGGVTSSAGASAASVSGAEGAAVKAGVPLIAKIIAGIITAALAVTGGVLWFGGGDKLSAEDKTYLTEMTSVLTAFQEEYQTGIYDSDIPGGLAKVESGIYAMQNTDRFRSIVDKLYDERGEGETLRFIPESGIVVLVYRTEYDGVPTYHFDFYQGKDGSGYFLGSRCGGGSIYYTLHVVPYASGKANGMSRNYLFPADAGEEPFVRQITLENGNAVGTIDYTYKSGETRQKDAAGEENWWPDWPKELA